jgi:hypothetical protein
MRNVLIPAFIFVFGVVFCGMAAAQAPAGYEAIYDGPTTVNLGGRPVIAHIALYTDMDAAARGDLRLALVTDVTDFVEETANDLEVWVAAHQKRCGERWGAGEPSILFPQGMIRFGIDLELELWNCGWNGKGEPGRIAREAGSVDVTLEPYIEDGKLQSRLNDFAVFDRSGISKYLPLETFVRRRVDAELKKLNDNPKFYRAPKPLYGEGFQYESIGAKKDVNGRVVITAQYKAKGSVETLDRITQKMREEGITQ